MIALSQQRTKRLVAIHGWSGAVLGLLLYVVLLTGAVAVFTHEIGGWSVGGAKSHAPFDRPMDGTLQDLAAQVPAAYRENVAVFTNSAGHIMAFLHTHAVNDAGDPDDKGVLFELHPRTHAILVRREGFGADVWADPWGALDSFLLELHINLHLPDPWGLYATGILGLLMLASAISGILIHRHLIKDLFVAPRLSSLLLNARDRHNLAGSWGLPFAFVLAFTGAFFSFALSLGLPTMGQVAFGGDQMAFFERLGGVPQAEDPAPARLANLDAMLAASARAAGSAPEGFSIRHFGRADARVSVFHPPPEGDLTAMEQLFDGTGGDHLGPKPSLGTAPSLGSAVFDLMFPLHFGTFAGLLSRVVWFALGLAMCYITVTGLQLWLRRRQDDPLWRRLARAVPVVGHGLPLAMLGAAYGFFLSLPAGATLFWTPVGFCAVAGGAILFPAVFDDDRAMTRAYQVVMAVLLLLLPHARMAADGPGWGTLFSGGNGGVVIFDITLILIGLGFWLAAAGWPLRAAGARGTAAAVSAP